MYCLSSIVAFSRAMKMSKKFSRSSLSSREQTREEVTAIRWDQRWAQRGRSTQVPWEDSAGERAWKEAPKNGSHPAGWSRGRKDVLPKTRREQRPSVDKPLPAGDLSKAL